ncbi:MAG: VPDSG-CTERM sorting domain-containing protein [Lentisphaerae bacterium]|nr:VPDSG-CTERM sorting domain-containing protein [Lentisphaerota bacterium]
MKNMKCGLVLAGVVALLATNGTAATYTMEQLMANGGDTPITIGDTVFSDWGFTGPLDASSVDVTASMFDAGSYQLRFEGSFIDHFSAESPGATDYRIYYSVATTSGGPLLTDIGQSFNLTALGAGGVIGIGETVFASADHTGTAVAQSSIGYVYGLTDSSDPLAEIDQGDQLYIDPSLSKVWVTKDVNVYAAPDSKVGATILYQNIAQKTSSVPDGASTLSLFGLGVMALGGLRRKLIK